jgi:hypothetical protein
MTLRRIAQSLSVVAVAGLLAGSTYVAGASTASGSHHRPVRHLHETGFVAPTPHKYGSNGMRMGLHCETVDIS